MHIDDYVEDMLENISNDYEECEKEDFEGRIARHIYRMVNLIKEGEIET